MTIPLTTGLEQDFSKLTFLEKRQLTIEEPKKPLTPEEERRAKRRELVVTVSQQINELIEEVNQFGVNIHYFKDNTKLDWLNRLHRIREDYQRLFSRSLWKEEGEENGRESDTGDESKAE